MLQLPARNQHVVSVVLQQRWTVDKVLLVVPRQERSFLARPKNQGYVRDLLSPDDFERHEAIWQKVEDRAPDAPPMTIPTSQPSEHGLVARRTPFVPVLPDRRTGRRRTSSTASRGQLIMIADLDLAVFSDGSTAATPRSRSIAPHPAPRLRRNDRSGPFWG